MEFRPESDLQVNPLPRQGATLVCHCYWHLVPAREPLRIAGSAPSTEYVLQSANIPNTKVLKHEQCQQ